MNTSTPGYFRHPAIAGDLIVFACEDALWAVSSVGGEARRLTDTAGPVSRPQLSRDGKWLAWSGNEEGHGEVYAGPARGGETRRLTWLGCETVPLAWTPDGNSIVIGSNTGQPFLRPLHAFTVPRDGGAPRALGLGPCEAISWGPRGARVIGRAMGDPARWKRYKGGTTGDLWVDPAGRGDWKRLVSIAGNLAWPFWVGSRVWFVSDHEGTGNLYSCLADGTGLRRETRHQEFYVRYPNTDGRRVVYQCGADLWVLDPRTRRSRRLDIQHRSPRAQRRPRFVDAARFLEDFALHPQGHSAVVTARGRSTAMAFWEGAVRPAAETAGARHRLTRWLHDGSGFVTVADGSGEEVIEVRREGKAPRVIAPGHDIGRVVDLAVSPVADALVFTNHRFELHHADLAKGKVRRLDRSVHERIAGIGWSPDGKWIAYAFAPTRHTSQIRVVEVKTGKVREVTTPDFRDYAPSWDPDGRYLYFLSYRVLDPVYDAFYFDLGFPRGSKPYVVTLAEETGSPFIRAPRPVVRWDRRQGDKPKEASGPADVTIDFKGIQGRVLAFPVAEGRYGQLFGMRGKVAWTSYPTEGSLGSSWAAQGEPSAKGALEIWDFEKGKLEPWVGAVTEVRMAGDCRTFAVRSGNRLRIVGADEKPKDDNGAPGRESGWLDLGRLRIPVDPPAEWAQMFREAWRLQRDHFYRADMAGLDWQGVFDRYRGLLDRIATRGELSDLIWEMQGELRTSHCYEIGGDYRQPPQWRQGFLGADLACGSDGTWKIDRVVRGDSWDPDRDSPLARPGVNARAGERVVSIAGRALKGIQPGELLIHRAGQEVEVVLADARGKERAVTIRALREESALRYRAWVDANRAWVHQASGERVGYLHIPNMGPQGFAEFHRLFYAEVDRAGLLVDLRHNGGGHVSQLLLEKLARRRLAYRVSRWSTPYTYPAHAPMGPMVALTDEYAGSDGDIFSHSWKLMKLGPLVGKRTWGGVVGIWPRHTLADGCITTQPEFSTWFEDVGFGVENYGTDPDIEVEIRPQDYAAGKDPQLERSLEEVIRLLKADPGKVPDLTPPVPGDGR